MPRRVLRDLQQVATCDAESSHLWRMHNTSCSLVSEPCNYSLKKITEDSLGPHIDNIIKILEDTDEFWNRGIFRSADDHTRTGQGPDGRRTHLIELRDVS